MKDKKKSMEIRLKADFILKPDSDELKDLQVHEVFIDGDHDALSMAFFMMVLHHEGDVLEMSIVQRKEFLLGKCVVVRSMVTGLANSVFGLSYKEDNIDGKQIVDSLSSLSDTIVALLGRHLRLLPSDVTDVLKEFDRLYSDGKRKLITGDKTPLKPNSDGHKGTSQSDTSDFL